MAKIIMIILVLFILIFSGLCFFQENGYSTLLNKYDNLVEEHNEFVEEHNEFVEEHNILVNKYNDLNINKTSLIADYNVLAEKYNDYDNICSLYNAKTDDFDDKARATGLYWFNEEYYCVWVENRELSDIEKTDRHEYCHYLVDDDYNHFCNEQIEIWSTE